MTVGKVSVAGGGAVPPVPEQLADRGQILARQDRLACGGVAQIVQAKAAELRVRADRAL